jgi:hypothetical protein
MYTLISHPSILKVAMVRGWLVILLVFLSLSVMPPVVVKAATITVCASGCNYTTISSAITNASPNDTITVLEAVHTENTIHVNKNLTIQGQGMDETIVQAATSPNTANARVFSINSNVTVTFKDMTIRYGYLSTDNAAAINALGPMTLERVRITDNKVTTTSPIFGGAIATQEPLFIIDCIISNNVAQGLPGSYAYGGALYLADGSDVTIVNSTFSGNQVIGGDKGASNPKNAFGGAIALIGGKLVISNSTVSSNMAKGGNYSPGGSGAQARGGGIYVADIFVSLPVTITNSTISSNTAMGGSGDTEGTAQGGGLWSYRGLKIIYSSVVSNTVSGDSSSRGGGLYYGVDDDQGPLLQNSLFANNTGATDANGPDIFGKVRSQDYNLIKNGNGFTLSGSTSNNLIGVDPNLGPLAFNGGATKTHPLLDPSPAIDAIPNGVNDCVGGVTTDQRGGLRGGGPGHGGPACDIGAFEFDAFLTIFLPMLIR